MSVRFLALVCSAFLLFPFSVHAFSSSASGKTVTFLPVTPTPSGAGGYQVSTASDGTVLLKSPKRISVPGGGTIPVDVTGGVPKANAGAAIGRFLLKGVGVVGVLQLGVAAYDLAQELGFTVDNSTGTVVVTQDVNSYGYRRSGTQPNGQPWPLRSSILLVCHDIMQSTIATNGFLRSVTETFPTYENISIGCAWSANPGGNTYGALRYTSTTPTPSDLDALTDAIAAKSGWPSTSALGRATVDAIKSGESLTVTPQTVTGPATSPGPVTQTVNHTDDTTKTTTVTHNHTYSGPNVTTTTTTTTVTINNTTNEVIDSSTTTTEPVMPESDSEDEGSPTDTPLAEVPQLYEPKYPDGIVGVWNAKKAELLDTSFMDTLSQLMPDVGSVGTCPVWLIPLDFDFFDAGDVDVSVPCWLWDFAKVVIIVSALLLARAIIFGG